MHNFEGDRRRFLAVVASFLAPSPGWVQASNEAPPVTGHGSPVTAFKKVAPGYTLRFPRDEGSHPEFRIEWWYVTGWLEDETRDPLGFQITFFRARPERKFETPSAFDPRHIMIGHAALADTSRGKLLHDERIARAGFGLAGAETSHTRAWIDDWSLEQTESVYRSRIPADGFALDLELRATQPPLLQGGAGFSRKGPHPASASYYYSLPHLEATGTVSRKGNVRRVRGSAWLDHEWSSDYLDARAAGWDWVGINFDDGSALMLFRIRDAAGKKFWAGGTLRRTNGTVRVFQPDEVAFIPGRTWRSPRTGTRYPVAWELHAGDLDISLDPLMDDQEYDARKSTGTIYWEGAVRVLHNRVPAGRGYLELTGYWRRLDL